MLLIRSALFNVLFYVNMIVLMIIGLPTIFMGRHAVLFLARTWARSSIWLLKVICGTQAEFRGIENIPTGGYIIAPKHQSIWETFALCLYFPDFSFILKRELTWIPVFGWYLKAAEQIAINRSSGSSALSEAVERSRAILSQGRQIFIFPEGTRRPVGAPPLYKFGVAHIYAQTNVACVPVALNAGLFWPRRSFVRRPGTIIVEFLEPIPAGLDRSKFFSELQNRLESATNKLINESLQKNPELKQYVYSGDPEASQENGR
jgi:1-acyl-sn-glycerol-3-phosphate acyltransferase